jgi:hypothetical protein
MTLMTTRHILQLSSSRAVLSLGAVLAACGGDGAIRESASVSGSTAETMTVSASGTTSATATGTDAQTTTTPTTGDSGTDSAAMGTSTGDSGTTMAPAACGDGKLDPGEGCDDGANNGPGKQCNPDCTPNVCGDGDLGPTEACDEGLENGPDGGCSATCTINQSACGEQSAEATLSTSPVDIIIVIDNSGSMGNEIAGVKANINVNFAQIIEDSGLDYRVIMVARHGAGTRVCIEAPLSGIPEGGCDVPPAQPVFNPGKFYHYSVTIGSHNAWCQLLSSFKGTLVDEFDLGVGGWQQWLREDAIKTFIAITDDGASCGPYNDNNTVNGGGIAAANFDADLLALSPQHFGSAQERNYQFYSIVGMAFNDPPTDPYTPMDPVTTNKCNTAADAGTGHQALSVLTNSLRFPLCDTTSYDVVFKAIADGVIKGAKVVCEFDVPEPPEGEDLDLDTVEVEYTPMGMGLPQLYNQVPSLAECAPKSFYIANGKVILCPETCTEVQKDKQAKILVKFSCEPIKPG